MCVSKLKTIDRLKPVCTLHIALHCVSFQLEDVGALGEGLWGVLYTHTCRLLPVPDIARLRQLRRRVMLASRHGTAMPV